jgi:hypothetical protein
MSSQPTTLISAAKEESMDFSMPSYGDATKGDVTSKMAIPSFNPFGDSADDSASNTSTKQADDAKQQQADKAAAKQQQADKAAAEADKAAADADKKAAKEAKKAEEKAARKLAEIEKQKEYAERSKAEASSSSKSEAPAPKIPDFKKPDTPEISIPEFKAPDISIPDFKAPSMPKIGMPKFDMPKVDTPKTEAPSGGGYNLDVPDFKAPEMPKFDMPKIGMPKFDMPKMESPSGGYDLDIPKVKAPKGDMPSISLPNPFGGGSSKSDDGVVVAPQETRDESARQALAVYKDSDQEAKVLEQQARELRDAAKAKKQLFNLAKDDACKTRPGGKILCLRNPFSAGF